MRYPIGTIIQHRTSYVFLKQKDGTWKAQHRHIAEQRLLHRELEVGERVFHKNGVREDNDKNNLVVIRFNTKPYVLLKHRRILFRPDGMN